jgi:tetratricopeptide (TPR) repeat protein
MPHTRYNSEQIRLLEEKWLKNRKSRVFAQLADCYRKMGRIEESIDICREGLVHCGDYPQGHLILGKSYMKLEMYEEARKAFAEALRLDPTNLVAMKLLGQVCEERRDWQQALSTYEDYLDLNPFDSDISSRMEKLTSKVSVKQGSTGSVNEAAGDGVEELNSGRDRPGNGYYTGMRYEEDEETAGEIDQEIIATTTLAQVFYSQGLLKKAREIYLRLLKKNPDNGELMERIAELDREIGEKQQPIQENRPRRGTDEIIADREEESEGEEDLQSQDVNMLGDRSIIAGDETELSDFKRWIRYIQF